MGPPRLAKHAPNNSDPFPPARAQGARDENIFHADDVLCDLDRVFRLTTKINKNKTNKRRVLERRLERHFGARARILAIALLATRRI